MPCLDENGMQRHCLSVIKIKFADVMIFPELVICASWSGRCQGSIFKLAQDDFNILGEANRQTVLITGGV